jgi:hypothetical protein
MAKNQKVFKYISRLITVIVGLSSFTALADFRTFTTKIADTSTRIPGSSETFREFEAISSSLTATHDWNFAISGRQVVFSGRGSTNGGVYLGSGGPLTIIADTRTRVPGSDVFFRTGGFPSIDGGQVAFLSFPEGIYLWSAGSISLIANRSTLAPGGSGPFTEFGPFRPRIERGAIAFAASHRDSHLGALGLGGIYLFDGTNLVRIADLRSTVPGIGGEFKIVNFPFIDGGIAAFTADVTPDETRIDIDGIYTGSGGPLSVVIDRRVTRIPDRGTTFEHLGLEGFDGGQYLIGGNDSSGYRASYISDGTTLTKVIDNTTSLPGGLGVFVNWRAALDTEQVVIAGELRSGQQAVYIFRSGELERVTGLEEVDGKRVAHIGINYESLSGNSIAMKIEFVDGSIGIYRADLSADSGGSSRFPICRRDGCPIDEFRAFACIPFNICVAFAVFASGILVFLGIYLVWRWREASARKI